MQKETIATHFGYDSKSGFGTMAVPIYFNTAYDFGSTKMAADRFALKDIGPIYTRLTNPTTEVFEKRICKLEDGGDAIATSSGQSAVFTAIANLAKSGDNVILSDKVYGGVTTLIAYSLKRFGIKTKFFDAQDPKNLESLIDENTKAIFFETLSNPQISVANVDEIVKIANKFAIATIADNTVATPVLYNPLKDGVSVVVHSASKYISGQGLSLGGVVISNKNLNDLLKNNPRYPHFNEPDESYHGLVYADLTKSFDIFILRARFGIMRDFGLTLSPFNSFQLIQGLETLSIRVLKHSQNALKIAEFLESHPAVKSVNYPGLKSSNLNNFISSKFSNALAGGLLSFEVESFEKAKSILDKVEIFSIVVNIGDSKSIITHPASTTHSQLNKEQLEKAGIKEGLIRLSIGLEDVEDLIKDLKKGLN